MKKEYITPKSLSHTLKMDNLLISTLVVDDDEVVDDQGAKQNNSFEENSLNGEEPLPVDKNIWEDEEE